MSLSWQDETPAPPPVEPAQNGAEAFGIRQGIPESASAIRPSSLRISPLTNQSTASGMPATRAQASTSAREGRIGDTMPRRTRRHYQRTPSRFARFASASVGLKPLSVEALVHGPDPIQDRFAALVAAALTLRDVAMEARLLGPVRAVIAACEALPLDCAVIRTASAADLRDDQSRMAYLLALAMDPASSHDELQQWLTDLDVSQGRLTELRAAIVGKLEGEK